jgi:hypothetical protein
LAEAAAPRRATISKLIERVHEVLDVASEAVEGHNRHDAEQVAPDVLHDELKLRAGFLARPPARPFDARLVVASTGSDGSNYDVTFEPDFRASQVADSTCRAR